MDQHEERICLTPILNQIYKLGNQLKEIKAERDKLILLLPDVLRDEYTDSDTEALEVELEEAKSENANLQSEIEHLKWQLENSEKSYVELAKQKRKFEEQKRHRNEAFWVSVYWGVPIGGLAIVALYCLCNWLGLFQGFFRKFAEYSESIAPLACGGIISYACIRLHYWRKEYNNQK